MKDDWEEEDEEPKPAPAPAPEPKKRMSVKQKIAEKEAMRQNDTGNDFDDWDLEESQVDETEQRRKEKEAQMRSDLDNAAALLAVRPLTKIGKERIRMSHLGRSQVPSHQAKKTGRRLPSRCMRHSSSPRPVCQALTSTSFLRCLLF